MDNKLERKYGLFTAICMVVGIVIGSGVFFKAQTILQKTEGNMPLGILAWIIGGAIMIYFGLKPGAAEIYGKAATMAFYLVMISIMAFGPEIGAFRSLFVIPDAVMMVLVVIAVIMTFVAFISYMPGVRRQVKVRFSPEGKEAAKAEKEAKAKAKAKK